MDIAIVYIMIFEPPPHGVVTELRRASAAHLRWAQVHEVVQHDLREGNALVGRRGSLLARRGRGRGEAGHHCFGSLGKAKVGILFGIHGRSICLSIAGIIGHLNAIGIHLGYLCDAIEASAADGQRAIRRPLQHHHEAGAARVAMGEKGANKVLYLVECVASHHTNERHAAIGAFLILISICTRNDCSIASASAGIGIAAGGRSRKRCRPLRRGILLGVGRCL